MRRDSEAETLYEGGHVRLVSRGGWEFAERTKGRAVVLIVAITDAGRLLLTEQYRPPVNGPVIELPAGLVGDLPGTEDEPLAAGARRELVEETGYDAAEIVELSAGPVSAGLCSEQITLVEARGLERVGAGGGDENEDITVHEVPVAEVRNWLAAQGAAGKLVDPKIFAGLHLVGAPSAGGDA